MIHICPEEIQALFAFIATQPLAQLRLLWLRWRSR